MKRILRALAVLLLLPPVVTSCSIKESIDTVRGEISEIAEFFGDKEFSDTPSETPAKAGSDAVSARLLESRRHTELFDSPYNRLDSEISVASVGSVNLCARGTELSEEQKSGYVYLPMPENADLTSLLLKLDVSGITPEVVERKNPAPAGEVFAIEFAGLSDDSGYYINPTSPVTLYVSTPKECAVSDSGDNLVYLTFDDGPTQSDTVRLLDILDSYGVKAMFFTMGESVLKYPDSARAVEERGHILGCHTMTHVYNEIYRSADALKAEVESWENALKSVGIEQEGRKYFRFPGGSVGNYFDDGTRSEMLSMLDGMGYLVYDWNALTNDGVLFEAPYGQSSYDYIRETLKSTLASCLAENAGKTGAPVMILMHEVVPETIDLMPWIIEYIDSQGLTFGNPSALASSWTFTERSNPKGSPTEPVKTESEETAETEEIEAVTEEESVSEEEGEEQ